MYGRGYEVPLALKEYVVMTVEKSGKLRCFLIPSLNF